MTGNIVSGNTARIDTKVIKVPFLNKDKQSVSGISNIFLHMLLFLVFSLWLMIFSEGYCLA